MNVYVLYRYESKPLTDGRFIDFEIVDVFDTDKTACKYLFDVVGCREIQERNYIKERCWYGNTQNDITGCFITWCVVENILSTSGTIREALDKLIDDGETIRDYINHENDCEKIWDEFVSEFNSMDEMHEFLKNKGFIEI